ncbi:MAG: hypothetical protein ACE5M4_13870, partial [Anaerolineales bacterium]
FMEMEFIDGMTLSACLEYMRQNIGEVDAERPQEDELPQAQSQGTVTGSILPEDFFISLEQELLAVLDPSAVRILDLDKHIRELGLSRGAYPKEKLDALIGRISSNIKDDESRRLFETKVRSAANGG